MPQLASDLPDTLALLDPSRGATGMRAQLVDIYRPSAMPYVTEVMFLSDPHLRVTLSPPKRHRVYGRDAENGKKLPPERATIGGIVEALTSPKHDPSGRPRRRIDAPLGAKIVKAVE